MSTAKIEEMAVAVKNAVQDHDGPDWPMKAALAALQAVREPTPGMLHASSYESGYVTAEAFTAMIDHLIQEASK